MSEKVVRNQGDSIRFRVMPWIWPDGKVYEGTILSVVDPAGDTYYHVSTTIGSEQVKEGLVFEREVVHE